MLSHAVEGKAVQAIARPSVTDTQGLKDHERLLEFQGPLDRPLETEVPARAAKGDHPVEHEIAVRPDRGVLAHSHADGWDAAHPLYLRCCQSTSDPPGCAPV